MKCFVLLGCWLMFSFICISHAKVKSPPWTKKYHNGKSKTPEKIQEKTAIEMLKRLLPSHYSKFCIEVDLKFKIQGHDAFKISSPKSANDSRVWILGTSGVTTSLGILHYLKYYCGSHISWEANRINIPSPLPYCHVKIPLLDTFRYYQNVCTLSYSFAWWNWAQWEQHIDWMALNGINFPLAFVGQEAIWRNVYMRFNFTQEDLDNHFAGPAFLAWGRMGNIQKWGGPLSDSWHRDTLELQKKILVRMRSFGMIPILPAFAGHVPSAITRIYPNAQVSRLTPWGQFQNDNYTRTYLLSPKDPLFSEIGAAFIEEMMKEYQGTDHYYNSDPLNEMVPPSRSTKYLKDISKGIYKAISKADPEATWVLQGWMFFHDFWTYKATKAFLTAVPQGRMIVLDLDAGLRPLYDRFDSFFGQPFIFCLLNNYGGVKGLYGHFDFLLKNLNATRSSPNASLIGLGLTPEGINQNYISYELMLELGWRNVTFDLDEWVGNFTIRRYGVDIPELKETWINLKDSVYQCGFRGCYHGNGNLIQHTPDMRRSLNLWYNESYVSEAWRLMLSQVPSDAINESATENKTKNNEEIIIRNFSSLTLNNKEFYEEDTYLYDLVDITRQVLQILGNEIIVTLRKCYKNNSLNGVIYSGAMLLEVLSDLDHLLGTSKYFLLGNWVTDAQSWATTEQERQQYLSNSLYQITLWGPNGEIRDYASKQWNGVVRDYMKPRYSLFVEEMIDCLLKGISFNQTEFNNRIFHEVEKPFADQVTVHYSTVPTGTSLSVVQVFYEKYSPYFTSEGTDLPDFC